MLRRWWQRRRLAREAMRLHLEWRRCVRYQGRYKQRADIQPCINLDRALKRVVEDYERIS